MMPRNITLWYNDTPYVHS